jgi:hypothetical protein
MRATADIRFQIRRYAQRLSGHGLSINTVTADESALLSAKRTRTPSHTRNSGARGEYPGEFIIVVSLVSGSEERVIRRALLGDCAQCVLVLA